VEAGQQRQAAWLEEVERVLPQLKVHLRADVKVGSCLCFLYVCVCVCVCVCGSCLCFLCAHACVCLGCSC
jgi:hypothetical protein